MKIADVSTPVLVLSPHHHGALGIVRSLGSVGVPVYAVRDDTPAPPLLSRYCRAVFDWDVRRASAQDSIARLLEIGRKFARRPILVPTDDTTAVLVQEASGALLSVFDFPVLPAGLARRLSSKKELYFLCREFGFPAPETVFPHSRFDLLQFIEKTDFPVVVKGIEDCSVGRTKSAMRIVHSADELLRCFSDMEDPFRPNLMLQEFIPGGADSVWMFNGYFNAASECLVAFTGKKLRQRPMNTGITTLGVCLRNETVEQSLRKLLQSVGYRGIVDIGCRFDARDGKYKLLDVNPRIGCTFRLFVDPSGMDVIRACYLDLTGQPVRAEPAREGRKWLVENQDILELATHFKARKLTIGQWLRSLRGVRETAWFNWLDPIPFFAMIVGLVRSFFREKFSAAKSLRPRAVPLKSENAGEEP